MAKIVMNKAKRKRVKLKLGIAGTSGSGKTMSSLLMAYGILKGLHPNWADEEIWDKIAVIDTENESAALFADMNVSGTDIGEFYDIPIGPPFTKDKYIDAITACKNSGIEICIIDSLTHLWDGEGGAKDKQGQIADRTKNSFTSWKEPKKDFRSVVDKILQTDMHFIVTMRSKTEYVQESVNNKSKVTKLGMSPIIMEGTDYEFAVFFEVDQKHVATVTKDRTTLFDGEYFVINPEVGQKLVDWLMSAKAEAAVEKMVEVQSETPKDDSLGVVIKEITELFGELTDDGKNDEMKEKLYCLVKDIAGKKNFATIADIEVANAVKNKLLEIKGE